jgi:hypothetical protein
MIAVRCGGRIAFIPIALQMQPRGIKQAEWVECPGTEGVQIACHNLGVEHEIDLEDGVHRPLGQLHDIANLFVSDGSVFKSGEGAKRSRRRLTAPGCR